MFLNLCGLSTESFSAIWSFQYKFLMNEFLIKKCVFSMNSRALSKIELIMGGILQNKRMRQCGMLPPPPPPPISFERLKLPQQIIYCRKENLLESPNHLKFRENILISRLYEHLSGNSRNLGHF